MPRVEPPLVSRRGIPARGAVDDSCAAQPRSFSPESLQTTIDNQYIEGYRAQSRRIEYL